MNQQRKFINYYKYKTKIKSLKLSKKDIVIIANYQPEATSFPIGKENNNHLDLIYKLRTFGF